MPEDENDDTGVFKQIKLEEYQQKKDPADEAGGNDPYNSIPDSENSD